MFFDLSSIALAVTQFVVDTTTLFALLIVIADVRQKEESDALRRS